MLHDRDYNEVQGEGVERDDPMDEGYAFKPVAECPVCNEPCEVNLIEVAGNPPMCEVCVYNTLDKALKAINENPFLNISAKINQCNAKMREYNCEPDMDWCSHCQRVTGHYGDLDRHKPHKAEACPDAEDGVQGCSWCSICNQ